MQEIIDRLLEEYWAEEEIIKALHGDLEALDNESRSQATSIKFNIRSADKRKCLISRSIAALSEVLVSRGVY